MIPRLADVNKRVPRENCERGERTDFCRDFSPVKNEILRRYANSSLNMSGCGLFDGFEILPEEDTGSNKEKL